MDLTRRQVQILAAPAAAVQPGDVFVVPVQLEDIATGLGISVTAVRTQVYRMLPKFGLPVEWDRHMSARLANAALRLPEIAAQVWPAA